ncbi:hypothetical protein GJ496_005903 [Pomphorhynchus laevis]|nr:hypothetical protein GJ496_005903 [Pomphorhynchus laevis]
MSLSFGVRELLNIYPAAYHKRRRTKQSDGQILSLEEKRLNQKRLDPLRFLNGEKDELTNKKLKMGGKENRSQRKRIIFTSYQTTELERIFAFRKYLTKKEREALSTVINLRPEQVKIWFQNHRYKLRKTQERLTNKHTIDSTAASLFRNYHACDTVTVSMIDRHYVIPAMADNTVFKYFLSSIDEQKKMQ